LAGRGYKGKGGRDHSGKRVKLLKRPQGVKNDAWAAPLNPPETPASNPKDQEDDPQDGALLTSRTSWRIGMRWEVPETPRTSQPIQTANPRRPGRERCPEISATCASELK